MTNVVWNLAPKELKGIDVLSGETTVKIAFVPFWKGFSQQGKNLLPL